MHSEYSTLAGYVKVTVSGPSCERFFNLCVNHNLSLYHITRNATEYTVTMKAADFLSIRRLVKKCHIHVRICEKHGFPFFLKRHKKHRMLLFGWIWCCFFIYLLSLRIWKIEISGNQEITRSQIMHYLAENDIYYGIRKNQIDCKQMAADMQNAFPGITWVAVKKQGTLLDIDMKENNDRHFEQSEKEQTPSASGSSLASRYDGKIIDIVTRAGIPQVKAGDTVRKGELLVSGSLPVTNDENETIAVRNVDADADIIIEISDRYEDHFSRESHKTVYTGPAKKCNYLKLFHASFSFGKPSILGEDSVETLVKEQQLSLFSDFYLPVIWGTVTITPCKTEVLFLSEADAKEKANQRLRKFLAEKKEKGVQILKKDVRIDTGMTICNCICTYQAYVSDTERIPSTQLEESEEESFS